MTMDITVKSTACRDGDMIPSRYTCDGENVSPELSWSDVPENTVSLALICDDPDAPAGTWVHWLLFNIPPDLRELPEDAGAFPHVSEGMNQGRTDYLKSGYGGPCPPSGAHRYFFKLYALDCKLNLDNTATKKKLVAEMKGHVLAQGQLMGRYKRKL